MLASVVRAAPPSAALRDAFAALRLDEIVGSTRLAGARLDATEVRALLDRGRALGGHRFDEYLIVRELRRRRRLGRAARHAPRPRDDRRPAHAAPARAARTRRRRRRLAHAHGAAAGGRDGPAAALARPVRDRDLRRPPRAGRRRPGPARARARGRPARAPPAVRQRQRPRRAAGREPAGLPPRPAARSSWTRARRRAYGAALRAALAGDATPLARVIGNALARGLERLRDVVEPVDELRPLAAFATNGRPDRLYKAAQRGRLRVVRRDGRLYTTAPWVAAYAAQPAAASA